jgi:hypothetical protein
MNSRDIADIRAGIRELAADVATDMANDGTTFDQAANALAIASEHVFDESEIRAVVGVAIAELATIHHNNNHGGNPHVR